MVVLAVGGIILGYQLGQYALRRHYINGVVGVVALLVLMCFAFTTMIGWCNFVRHSQIGTMLVSSWTWLFFCAWLGLFGASLRNAILSMRQPISAQKFSSLSDKYEIVYDDPYHTGKVAPLIVPKPQAEPTEVSEIELPFSN